MFKSLVTIIVIKEDAVTAANIKSATGAVQKVESVSYTPEILTDAFRELKKKLRFKKARLLLPEERTYLKLVNLPVDTQNLRAAVEEKIAGIIPEPLTNLVFDLRETSRDQETIKVQILAAARDYLLSIKKAAQGAGIEFEATETPSFALARLTEKEQEPHLVLYANQEMLAVAAQAGEVLEAIILNPEEDLNKKISALLSYVKREFGLEIKKILYSGPPDLIEKIKIGEVKVKGVKLDPMVGLARKKDILGKDEKVLSLELPEIPETPRPELVKGIKIAESASKGIIKNIAMAIFGLVLLAAGGFLIYQKLSPATPTLTPISALLSPAPTLEPTGVPTATPILLVKSDLTIKVLNGRGAAGTAADASDFLQGLGYTVIDIDNADRFDYALTEVKIKKSKENFISLLTNDLKEKYALEVKENLPESELFDILVIIGKE